MSALLPCPFCGGEARLHAAHGLDYVRCTGCGACSPEFDDHAPGAIAAWNRRATPAEVEKLRAQLAAAREALERIVGGDHPEGTSLAVNNNYRELEARLRAIARAALAKVRAAAVEGV